MKKGFTIVQKFLFFLSVFFILAVVDSILFVKNLNKVSNLDTLESSINEVNLNVVRFEYDLDFFVLGASVEGIVNADLLKRDIETIEDSLETLKSNDYTKVFKDEMFLTKYYKNIVTNLEEIISYKDRLRDDFNEDEVIAFHNSIDMKTQSLRETLDRLGNIIEETEGKSVKDIFLVTVVILIVSIFVGLLAVMGFLSNVLLPFDELFKSVKNIESKDKKFRIKSSFKGETGKFVKVINDFISTLEKRIDESEETKETIMGDFAASARRIVSIEEVSKTVGKSLSRHEVFLLVLSEMVNVTKSKASAIYLKEGDKLKLQSSKGFKGKFFSDAEELSYFDFTEKGNMEEPQVFLDYEGVKNARFKNLLKEQDVQDFIAVPIPSEGDFIGFLMAFYPKSTTFNPNDIFFFKALASNVSVSLGYTDLFYKEHGVRSFLERVFSQMPFAVAVFNKSGLCKNVNANFKSLFSVKSDFDIIEKYNIFEDDNFSSNGDTTALVSVIEKGKKSDLKITYDPTKTGKCEFKILKTEMEVSLSPVFDATGNVINILAVYKV